MCRGAGAPLGAYLPHAGLPPFPHRQARLVRVVRASLAPRAFRKSNVARTHFSSICEHLAHILSSSLVLDILTPRATLNGVAHLSRS